MNAKNDLGNLPNDFLAQKNSPVNAKNDFSDLPNDFLEQNSPEDKGQEVTTNFSPCSIKLKGRDFFEIETKPVRN